MSDNGAPPIHRIIYRDVLIEIWLETRGGTCCGLEHDSDNKFCINCGNPLTPREVHTIAINGTKVAGFEVENEAEAIDMATRWVDHIIEFADEERDGFEDEYYDDYEDSDEELIDEDPDDEDDDDEDNRHIVPRDPPDTMNESSDDGWSNPQMTDIIRQMEKLKWFEKAAAIAKNKPDKPLKKKG